MEADKSARSITVTVFVAASGLLYTAVKACAFVIVCTMYESDVTHILNSLLDGYDNKLRPDIGGGR
ncbi:hypothetical protein INR49_022520 [Caranx melampygus]|nr:hypothetical protein INR49_022520 [Caranx melampygus]